MAKYKTIKDNVNVFDSHNDIIQQLPLGSTIDIEEIVKADGKADGKELGIMKGGKYIISSYLGSNCIQKVLKKTTKKKGE